ncbi:MAG TPA: lysophospholipid acyltransferase family protein, partial [Gemmatimonadaceae bacterium]|nr:lysophospholipid acyltransferase family protein [Gemmatimonadaceae bacterium]
TLLTYVAIVVMTIAFGIPIVVATMLGVKVRAGSFWEDIPRIWTRAVLRAAGARVKVINPEHMAPGEPRVYVANHVSWFDVFALAAVLPRYRFVAKKELFKIPIFGPAAGQVAGIYIDRHNRKAAFESYRDAAERMRGGISVIVFPEGTRGRSYELRPFKKGPFVLAIAAQVPIVPCVVHGTKEIQGKGEATVRAGEIEVTLLEPIPTAGLSYEERDELLRRVWTAMAAELERHGVRSHGKMSDTEANVA